MDQRLSLVTLAVEDLDATRHFYCERLGWTSEVDVPGDVLMLRAGEHLMLSFWVRPHFEAELGPVRTGPGLAPVTLAHNVATREEVDDVLAAAQVAGADPVVLGQEREWGGYTGYFADPDGYRWEIAWNSGPIADVVIP